MSDKVTNYSFKHKNKQGHVRGREINCGVMTSVHILYFVEKKIITIYTVCLYTDGLDRRKNFYIFNCRYDKKSLFIKKYAFR